MIQNVKLNNVPKVQKAFGTVSEEEALKIVDNINKQNEGLNIKYLILVEGETQSGERYRNYHFSTGRQSTYDYIKNMLMNSDDGGLYINTTASKVLVEPKDSSVRISLSNMLSIHRFMDEMKINNKVVDNSDFDIYDWYDEEAQDISFDEGDADYI